MYTAPIADLAAASNSIVGGRAEFKIMVSYRRLLPEKQFFPVVSARFYWCCGRCESCYRSLPCKQERILSGSKKLYAAAFSPQQHTIFLCVIHTFLLFIHMHPHQSMRRIMVRICFWYKERFPSRVMIPSQMLLYALPRIRLPS